MSRPSRLSIADKGARDAEDSSSRAHTTMANTSPRNAHYPAKERAGESLDLFSAGAYRCALKLNDDEGEHLEKSSVDRPPAPLPDHGWT